MQVHLQGAGAAPGGGGRLAQAALAQAQLLDRLALARRQSAQVALLNLDMDGLKPINDQFGHRAGDAAIRETAQRIRRVSRQSDTVARLGGDEFAIILPDIASRDSALSHAGRVAAEIGQSFDFEGRPLELGASIGVATFPLDGTEPDALIEQADQAMYATKRSRKVRRA